MMLPFVLLF